MYDQDRHELTLRTKVLNETYPKIRNACWEDLQTVPATVLNLKRILVNGALITAIK